jgi:hypothetical protein
MGAKRLLFDDDARERMRRGIDTLAEAVKVTLRPRGCTSEKPGDAAGSPDPDPLHCRRHPCTRTTTPATGTATHAATRRAL